MSFSFPSTPTSQPIKQQVKRISLASALCSAGYQQPSLCICMGPAVLEPWPLLYDGKEKADNSNCKLSSNIKEFCSQKRIRIKRKWKCHWWLKSTVEVAQCRHRVCASQLHGSFSRKTFRELLTSENTVLFCMFSSCAVVGKWLVFVSLLLVVTHAVPAQRTYSHSISHWQQRLLIE